MRNFKIDELNRKINMSIWISVIILILIISNVLMFLYIKRNKVYYVHYDESSDLNYEVALKENDYFDDDHLHKDNQYIASLIDYVTADFKYNLNVKEDLKYKYNYKIIANVNVIDNDTHKSLYSFSENILDEVIGESDGVLNINESVKIDYNKYNSKISEFVKFYNLAKTNSMLTLKMYVGIDGDLEELNKNNSSVISLDMPLAANTIAINVNYDLSNNVDNLIELKSSYQNSKILPAVAIIMFVIDLGIVGAGAVYFIRTRTDEDKYNGELKKILNNYGSFISQVEDEFDMTNYQILKVSTFADLLEIRDTIHIPIIMIEKKEQCLTCFIIPTTNNILYFYSLSITQYALPTGGKHAEEV